MNQALFWLTYRHENEIMIFIQPASHLLMARIKATLAGVQGEFAKGHQLDETIAEKMPRNCIGRSLSRTAATTLLNKLNSQRRF